MHVNEKGERDWLRSCDGYLTFPRLTDSSQARIVELASRTGLLIEVGNDFLEISYEGRDRNEVVIAFLRDLAVLIVDAQGEIRCEVSGEQADPTFEFFRIVDARLMRQRGHLVRSELEKI